MFPRSSVFLFLFSMCICLPGCLPLTAVVATQVGQKISEERTPGTVVDDGIITTKIFNKFSKSQVHNLVLYVSVNTREGRVLLTGAVPNHAAIVEAVRIAWSTHGVKEVLNELTVMDSKQDKKALAKDNWISINIKSKFLLQRGFKSVNYTYSVHDGVVYLMGIAQNEVERNIALSIASSVKGVKRIVNYVILKDDVRRPD